jgi:hypothetical protein
MDISASIEHAIANYFSQWWIAHPYLFWMISHPLPSLGLLLLTIFSLWGLMKAIGRGIEQIWLFLLTTPFKLLQPIFRAIWRSIQRVFGHNNSESDRVNSQIIPNSPTERIDVVVDRLQILNREQDLLLQELATLTSSSSVTPQRKQKSDTQYGKMYAKLLK